MKIMMQDKRTRSMDRGRVQEISDNESLGSEEEKSLVVIGCVNRVRTFESKGSRNRIGNRKLSRASTLGSSRANKCDEHQLQDAFNRINGEL